MRTLLVHNPKSGDGTPSAECLQSALSRGGLAVTYCSKDDQQYKAALAEPWDLVVIAGGDGTVAKGARHLRDRSIPVAILPTGTANNVARSLGLLGSPKQLAAKLRDAPFRPLDIGLAKGPWGESNFVEAVGLGAVPRAITRSGPKPPFAERIKRGREVLRDAIAKAKPYRFASTIDAQSVRGEFLFVEILNLRFSGSRLPIAFYARPGDQLLDVVLLSEDQREKMLAWLDNAPEESPPPVTVHTGRRVELTWEDAPLRIDDQVCALPKEPSAIEIGLEKESLKVLCPD